MVPSPTMSDEESPVVVVEEAPLSREKQARGIVRDQVEAVYVESLDVMYGTMLFSEITVKKDEEGRVTSADPMPKDWVDRFGGMERAQRLYNMACAAWENKSEAPVGLEMALKMASTVMKVEAVKTQSTNVLNIINTAAIDMPSPAQLYPEVIKDDDD